MAGILPNPIASRRPRNRFSSPITVPRLLVAISILVGVFILQKAWQNPRMYDGILQQLDLVEQEPDDKVVDKSYQEWHETPGEEEDPSWGREDEEVGRPLDDFVDLPGDEDEEWEDDDENFREVISDTVWTEPITPSKLQRPKEKSATPAKSQKTQETGSARLAKLLESVKSAVSLASAKTATESEKVKAERMKEEKSNWGMDTEASTLDSSGKAASQDELRSDEDILRGLASGESPLSDVVSVPDFRILDQRPEVELPRSPCLNLKGSSDVVIILKTGAAEVYEKLTQHFLTTFTCTPDFVIYSDMEQDFGPFRINDALAGVSMKHKDNHKDFSTYRNLAASYNASQDLSKLKGGSGWDLDKWKFIPMMQDAYRKYPSKKWFILVEADTYLSWTNLLQWIQHLPSDKPVYAGCAVAIGSSHFAHGGSSVLMSNNAVERLSSASRELVDFWEDGAPARCCGDQILGEALLDQGVKIMDAWPLIQGATPVTLDWSERHWCAPAVSWHHMNAAEVDAVWQFEMQWIKEKGSNTPILFSDHFAHFILPQLSPSKSAWDNLSNDLLFRRPSPDAKDAQTKDPKLMDPKSPTQESAHLSPSACQAACNESEDCLTWKHEARDQSCWLGNVVKLGRMVLDARQGEEVTSGWMAERIDTWIKSKDCNRDEGWMTNVPEEVPMNERVDRIQQAKDELREKALEQQRIEQQKKAEEDAKRVEEAAKMAKAEEGAIEPKEGGNVAKDQSKQGKIPTHKGGEGKQPPRADKGEQRQI